MEQKSLSKIPKYPTLNYGMTDSESIVWKISVWFLVDSF